MLGQLRQFKPFYPGATVVQRMMTDVSILQSSSESELSTADLH